MLRHVLLALLSDGRPAHGYALMKAYAARSGVRLSIGNVYRELQRLVADGLIRAAANPLGADPRRSPYVITEAGRQVLRRWLAAPAWTLALSPIGDALSYRLALVGDLQPTRVAAFLDELETELRGLRTVVERQRAIAGEAADAGSREGATRAVLLGRRTRQLAADLEMVADMRIAVASWGGASRSATSGRASRG